MATRSRSADCVGSTDEDQTHRSQKGDPRAQHDGFGKADARFLPAGMRLGVSRVKCPKGEPNPDEQTNHGHIPTDKYRGLPNGEYGSNDSSTRPDQRGDEDPHPRWRGSSTRGRGGPLWLTTIR